MREFGNSPRPKPWHQQLLAWLVEILTGVTDQPPHMNHDERMRRRRRKTKFAR